MPSVVSDQELFRPGCTSSALYEFACPESSPHEHTRHADPERCDQFYLCITGRARKQSCSPGLVFSTTSLACEGQESVEGPCSRFYNQTYLESLTTPAPLSPALSANRVASQERRRPVRPQLTRQPQPQPPPEQIPQQLLDLQNFGQSRPAPSAPVRGRVPATRVRQEEKESFFNNLDQRIREREQQPARPFSRPPLRRPAGAQLEEETPRFEPEAPAVTSGFGRRRQPFRQRPATERTVLSEVEAELARRELQQQQVREELDRRELQQKQVEEELARRRLQQQQVEEELARRELQQQQVEEELARRKLQQQQVREEQARREQNLGPSALDALLSRGRQSEAPSPPSRGSLRRGPVSRGGVGRGRLEVLDNRRPPLQPQLEDQQDFETNFNSFRQRNGS